MQTVSQLLVLQIAIASACSVMRRRARPGGHVRAADQH